MTRSPALGGGVGRLAGVILAGACSLPGVGATEQAGEPPWFEDVTDAVGLHFVHHSGAAGDFQIPEIMGAGVALLDVDRDGDLDVFLVQSAHPNASGANRGGARLWRNDLDVDATGRPRVRFHDITSASGIASTTYGMGATTGDIDGDGDLDLYVTAYGHNTLYRNNGDGTFTDVTATAGVDDPRWSTSAAFVDIDTDGHLDLFVANYLDIAGIAQKPCFEPAGTRDYCPPTQYRPVADRLFRNTGDGTFEDVSQAAGILRAFGNGLGVSVGDYDGDGRPDLYVANDATPNQWWRNLGAGRFEDLGPISGAAFNASGRAEGSMGIASADADRDGDEDLVVTNIAGETFALYENDGRGGFDDRRSETGLALPTAGSTGFGVAWLDADLNGVMDLVAANGAVTIVPALRGTANPYRQRAQLFEGLEVERSDPGRRGAGPQLHLRERSGRAAGAFFERLDVWRGLAVGDLDNDGRPDIVMTANDGAARVLRNVAAAESRWIGVELRQPGPNPLAFGARIVVESGPSAGRAYRVGTDGSYLSASDHRRQIGLGRSDTRTALTVTWPDGSTQRVADLEPNRYHTVERSERVPPDR